MGMEVGARGEGSRGKGKEVGGKGEGSGLRTSVHPYRFDLQTEKIALTSPD